MEKKQFVVIGLGRFGESIACTLFQLGHDVLAVDIDDEQVEKIKDAVTLAVTIPNTNEETLKALGLNNFDVGIVAIGKDIQANILSALILKELGVKEVVARAQSPLHGKVLEKIGTDRIIYPERDMGTRVAYNLTSLSVIDYIELSPEYSIEEILVHKEMANRTIREMDIRAKYGINVLAIKKGEHLNISPEADAVLQADDILIVMGPNSGLLAMKKRFIKASSF